MPRRDERPQGGRQYRGYEIVTGNQDDAPHVFAGKIIMAHAVQHRHLRLTGNDEFEILIEVILEEGDAHSLTTPAGFNPGNG